MIARMLPLLLVSIAIADLLLGCTRTQPETKLDALGKTLFFDASLSADARVSCASCHIPSKAFSDGRDRSIGVGGQVGTRNAPSLLNSQDGHPLFWDGRDAGLAHATTLPLFNPVEMGLTGPSDLLARIDASREYSPGLKAELRKLEPEKAVLLVGDALAAFIATLSAQQPKPDAPLTAQATSGRVLFEGRAGCSDCHVSSGGIGSLTDEAYHNTGLGNDRLLGNLRPVLATVDALRSDSLRMGRAVLAEADIAEMGRYIVSGQPGEIASFKTPSLHHVALTAPYMHNGSIATLSEAIDHELYYRGLSRGKPIELTVSERRQLIAYLETLTGD